MRAKCLNGCFEREIPKDLEEQIKKDERFLNCSFCLGRVILISEDIKITDLLIR